MMFGELAKMIAHGGKRDPLDELVSVLCKNTLDEVPELCPGSVAHTQTKGNANQRDNVVHRNFRPKLWGAVSVHQSQTVQSTPVVLGRDIDRAQD